MDRGIPITVGLGLLMIAGVAVAQEYPPFDPTVVSNIATNVATSVGQTAGTSAGTGVVTAQVQRINVVTDTAGNFAGNWPQAFASVPGWYQADVDIPNSSASPYKCSFYTGTVTTTAFSGKCSQIVATTLPTVATSLLGLTVSPLANAASGLTVRVIGRQ
jgi:hypothetical protein